MANTYSQAHFHLVFAVKHRQALIQRSWKNELERYITGVVQHHHHKMLAIGAMPNHIHIFLGYNLNHLIPDLVEEIKTSSNHWIKEKGLSRHKFDWQRGYGAFTHSRSQVDAVISYVLNQEAHHSRRSFREEYKDMLQKAQIAFEEQYLFQFFDDVQGWDDTAQQS
jgi:REP element-mobilizing transposase RayT